MSYKGPKLEVGRIYRVKTTHHQNPIHQNDFIAIILAIDKGHCKIKILCRLKNSGTFDDIHECVLFDRWGYETTEVIDVTTGLGEALYG